MHFINFHFFLSLQEFEDDYTEFKAKTLDIDRHLASVLSVGFHDCSGLESLFQVSTHIHETVLRLLEILCIYWKYFAH